MTATASTTITTTEFLIDERMTQKRMSWEDAVRWLIDQPDQAVLTRAAYLDPPVAGAARRYHASTEWQAVRSLLPTPPGRALDLGAGNGIMSYALAADGWTVTAVEPDPSPLVGAGAIRALASETGVAIEVIEAFGEAIPLEAANFDVVIARQVLHHAHDLPAFAKEMARLVRPGGTVITLRDHVVDGPASLAAFLEQHPLHHLYGGEHAFSRDEYRTALEGAGLRIEQEFGSFDSVINYAPRSEFDIRDELVHRLPRPLQQIGRPSVGALPFGVLCRSLSLIDRRPGRLMSFVARKPGAG